MSKSVTHHLPCKDCGSTDALSEYEDSTYCFSCKTYNRINKRPSIFERPPEANKGKIVDDMTDDIPLDVYVKYLGKYGISRSLAQKYGILFCRYYFNGQVSLRDRLILPIFKDAKQVGFQARATVEGDSPKYYTVGDKSGLYWVKDFKESKELVIVEDILSAMKVGTMKNTVALLGTTLPEEQLLTIVRDYDIIYIWLDGDKPGIKAAKQIHKKLDLYKESIFLIQTKEDPKCVFFDDIRQILSKY